MTVVSLTDKLDTGHHLGMVKQIVKAITELKEENKNLKKRIEKLEDMDNETLRNDFNKEQRANN